MWIAFDLHEHIAAGCFKDGWSLLIHRMPGSSDKGVFISLHMPENFSHKIDPARPPFLYADDAEIDLGHSITMQFSFQILALETRTTSASTIGFLAGSGTETLQRAQKEI